MRTLTKELQDKISPQTALDLLKKGNDRFLSNSPAERNLLQQVETTRTGQHPFAAILGCIDSRVPTEMIFDQGFGDIFTVRIAGNIVNTDILGSLEYSCKVAGAKIIVVLGHTHCGAVTAACNKFKLGNLSSLLEKIEPARKLTDIDIITEERINRIAFENIKHSIERIKIESTILKDMAINKEIIIVGAFYNVSTGHVEFFDF